ncbi:hypothetical protein [Persephonella sp. IF05-L8]
MEDNKNNNNGNEELPEFPDRIINEGYIPDKQDNKKSRNENIEKKEDSE